MKILPENLWEQKQFQSHLPEARAFLKENRVYNLKVREGELRGYVLGDEPLPREVLLQYREENKGENRIFWSCECGDEEFCVHLAALVLRIEGPGQEFGPWKTRLACPEGAAAVSGKPSYSDDGDADLFGGDLFSAPAVTERASSAPAASADYQDDIPLFRDLSEEDLLLHHDPPRYDLIFTLSVSRGEGILVRPALIRLREGVRSGSLARYKRERPVSVLRPEQQDLLNSLMSTEEESLPLEECLGDVLKQSELFTTAKSILEVYHSSRVEISFHFQELLGDDRPLYYPEYRFFHDRGDEAITGMSGGLIIRGGKVFYLDEKKAILILLKEDSNASFFLNLLQSKNQGFLAADIRGLLRLGKSLSGSVVDICEDYPPVSIRKADPDIVLKMRSRQDRTELFFFFRYGSSDVAYQDPVYWLPPGEPEGAGVLIIEKRNREKESELVKQVVEKFSDNLSFEKGYYARLVNENRDGDLRLDMTLEEFLASYARSLKEIGVELQLEERKISSAGNIRFNVKGKTDWLEVDAMMEDPDTQELKSLFLDDHYQTLGLISTGSSYIKLNELQLRQLEYLQRQGMDEEGKIKVSPSNFSLVDSIYEQVIEKEGSPIEDAALQAREFRNAFNSENLSPPERINATLRPYQLSGYNWLRTLHNLGYAGCLADDMGLGKTLQTLSLLQSLKESGDLQTSLLVAPVVTLANWEREMDKFTPELSYYRHAGSERHDDADLFGRYDLVIVSYHTLRNDVDLFLDRVFDYIILDEAHYIKNASSIIFKSIRSLKSRHRLSLTGTPIENNTMELWSQFNFLNSGLLGSQKDFISRFANPIEKKQDRVALDLLKERVSPFILRRKKEDVLDDLPPKEIIVNYCEMGETQSALYNKYRDYYRARVKGLLDEKGVAGSSMEIFQFILKLRQIAIFPPMSGNEGKSVASCKMDALFSLLDEVLEEDHKILIFSQFLGSLRAMEEHCRVQHWDYSFITGQTSDREEQIRRFQEEEDVKVFLLSLKAGGVGINLTAADYVVLFDPWWNPAAERQAIDRAHRMGQKRKVLSYKMIARDTIEEKILKMQEEKTALLEGVISEDSGFFGSLQEDEIVDLFN